MGGSLRFLFLALFFLALGLQEQLVEAFGRRELTLDVRDLRGSRTGLTGTRQDLDDLPALRRAVWPRLLDAHEVALAHVARLVVGREALPHANDLFVERVLAHAADRDDDRVRHLRGHDDADLRLATETAPPGRGLARRGRLHARDGRRRALAHRDGLARGRDRALARRGLGGRVALGSANGVLLRGGARRLRSGGLFLGGRRLRGGRLLLR